MKNVFHISGGRSSAMMVLQLYRPGDIVIFCDTGREYPKTYEFLKELERVENIKIHYASYPVGFSGMVRKERYIPNISMRICTKLLKIKTARRYLRKMGVFKYNSYIGYRSDETKRVLKYRHNWKAVKTYFPLHSLGYDKNDVLEFWKQKPYNLDMPEILGNCDLCFLKGKNAIIQILRKYPHLADKWIADEKEMGKTYIKGVTYEQLKNAALLPYYEQSTLFEVSPAFDCSCNS